MTAAPRPSSRVVLVARTPSDIGAASPKIRRYRLARLRVMETPDPLPARYAHLRRSYD